MRDRADESGRRYLAVVPVLSPSLHAIPRERLVVEGVAERRPLGHRPRRVLHDDRGRRDVGAEDVAHMTVRKH
jgi:hypothetical protein